MFRVTRRGLLTRRMWMLGVIIGMDLPALITGI